MNKMMRHSQWSNDDARQDPLGQLVDRLFEGSLFRAGASDESSVVTSQWIPRVDIKEEADRFVIYADIGVLEITIPKRPETTPRRIEIGKRNKNRA